MRTPGKLLCLACSILWILFIGCQKQQDEMPATTTSTEAHQLYLQAMDKIEGGEVTAATSLLDQALQKDTNFAMAYIARSIIEPIPQSAKKDREKALMLKDHVSNGERIYITAFSKMYTNEVKEALALFDSLARLYPRDKRLQEDAGFYHGATSGYKEGLSYVKEAIAIDPKYAAAYNILGYFYMNMDSSEAAEKAFKTYITLRPTGPNPYDSYGEFLLKQGRYDESIAHYKKAIEIDPTFATSILGLGDNYLRKGDLAKAVEQYEMAAEKSPAPAVKLAACHRHAAAHVLQGSIPDAVSALDERKQLALKENQNLPAVRTVANQGYILSTFGQNKEGLKKYQEAREMANTLTIPEVERGNIQFLSNQWLAYAYIEGKDFARAKQYMTALQKEADKRKNPDDVIEVKAIQAYLDLKQGRVNDALQKLTAIPENPWVLHSLLDAYTRKGDQEKAKATLDKLNHWKTIDVAWAIETREAALMRGI